MKTSTVTRPERKQDLFCADKSDVQHLESFTKRARVQSATKRICFQAFDATATEEHSVDEGGFAKIYKTEEFWSWMIFWDTSCCPGCFIFPNHRLSFG